MSDTTTYYQYSAVASPRMAIYTGNTFPKMQINCTPAEPPTNTDPNKSIYWTGGWWVVGPAENTITQANVTSYISAVIALIKSQYKTYSNAEIATFSTQRDGAAIVLNGGTSSIISELASIEGISPVEYANKVNSRRATTHSNFVDCVRRSFVLSNALSSNYTLEQCLGNNVFTLYQIVEFLNSGILINDALNQSAG